MTLSPQSALAERILSPGRGRKETRDRQERVRVHLLSKSLHIRVPDFLAISPEDLLTLFNAYDREFLGGGCRRALGDRKLDFRLSKRMTRAGGKTTQFRSRNHERYEIAISSHLLFDGFRGDDDVSVCGLPCASRLDALQRIFEHELVHLCEMLCWKSSSCGRSRFQKIARDLFGHRARTHSLITRADRAAEAGIGTGSRVTFAFQGERLTGRVNRVTKRVTVLVEDAAGTPYSDGKRYAKYYVPLAELTPADPRKH